MDIGELPDALESLENGELERRLEGRRPAVFLDYDGTLTPIVDRPGDAVISGTMREAVSSLAGRCPVCVVSGRDRRVVQELMGLDDLIVAGSHGFDIWSPEGGEIEHSPGTGFGELLREAEAVEGALIEPKNASVAVHYRLVREEERPKIKELVDGILAAHPGELKVTPGKMVYEVQPNIDWDKGRAVLYLLEALELDRDDVVPIYLGDDATDEHAFEALSGTSPPGVGVLVGDTADPDPAGRTTAAGYGLRSVEEVEHFLGRLAR